MLHWKQLEIHIDKNLAEPLGDLLTGLGALAITLVDAEDHPIFEPDLGETPYWEKMILLALFAEEDNPSLQLNTAAKILNLNPLPTYQVKLLKEKDWQNQWKKFLKPRCYANKLWVVPTGCQPPVLEAQQKMIQINPGLAFGTGSHPTTSLCLQWLAEHLKPQQTVIDYGCGSGILAIAALALGAEQVYAIDHDDQALAATLENAKLNHVDKKKLAILKHANSINTRVDIIVANILLQPLIELLPVFDKLSQKNTGKVIFSGVLSAQEQQLKDKMLAFFQYVNSQTEKNWILLEGMHV
ncbi:MAG: 50S ribosomal protein L11 methyltransferase [Pseudomonadota bacterium]